MNQGLLYPNLDENRSSGPIRTILDVIVVLLVVAAVIAVAASAPSNTYAYAQLQQIGAVVGTIESGNWLLPRDHGGGLARKPQLYAWLDAPILIATGIYDDFNFRLPTVVATFIAALMVYFLGRRWYDRRTGLMAACLWVTIRHMGKLSYIAVTDMLMTVWIIGAIMCADRLLFHRAPRDKRRRWAIGLWVMMILGAMTKGWGVLNLILVGGMLALAVAVWPGFKALRLAEDSGGGLGLTLRLLGRRWWRAIKATRFGWGILAMVVVLAPVCIGMFIQGGEEFREIIHYEFVSRVTGGGENAPHSSSVPAVVHLMYYALPVSIFMIGALLLTKVRLWFSRRGPICLPLCWMLAVVVPFSLTHGFRPDYLLPCYAPAALMGAWAVGEIVRRGRSGGITTQILRHVFAAVPVVIGILLILLPMIYLFHDYMPGFITKNIKMPSSVPSVTWRVLCGLIALGAVVLALSVRWSLQWRLRRVAAVAVVGMLGIIFIDRHMFTRHARTGDGEKMIAFARDVKGRIGGDEFAVFRAGKLATELYLGRFGAWPEPPGTPDRKRWDVQTLNRSDVRWLVTNDCGLIGLGATEIISQDGNKIEVMKPGDLGVVEVRTAPVISQKWGRAYLIRLRRPIRVRGKPRATEHESGRQDKW